MKKIFLSILIIFCSFKEHSVEIAVDKPQAQEAFELINKIRLNPSAYTLLMGVDLSNIHPKQALIWNDTLAKAAEAKAMDMAKRNYFDHVNPDGYGMNYFINKAGYKLNMAWLKNVKDNFFESIQAGASSGEEAVKYLIVDSGIPSLGHRKHLLGMDEWNGSLYDIGIGFVKAGEAADYQSYTCVLIAKHNW